MALLEIFDPAAAPRPVGIDLGTTNSIVARMRDGRPTAILDCDSATLVPSAVFYDKTGQIIVGTEAMRMASTNPSDTIVSVKRFMGRGAHDSETQKLGTYVFVPPADEAQARTVRFKVREQVVTPVEVTPVVVATAEAQPAQAPAEELVDVAPTPAPAPEARADAEPAVVADAQAPPAEAPSGPLDQAIAALLAHAHTPVIPQADTQPVPEPPPAIEEDAPAEIAGTPIARASIKTVGIPSISPSGPMAQARAKISHD